MKTIDKVSVFDFYGLYYFFLESTNKERNQESKEAFKNELRKNNCIWNDNANCIIGYEIDELFGIRSQDYIKSIRDWNATKEVKINCRWSDYGSFSIWWDCMYERIQEHNSETDTYFLPEEVEKLVSGEIDFIEFTNKAINQCTIDYLKEYVLEYITCKINNLTPENLKWE